MSENIEFKDIDFQEYEYNSFSALAITAYILKMYEYCAKGKIAEAVLISDYLEKGINNISKLLRTSVSLEIIIFKATKLKDTSNVKEIIETLPKSQQRQMKKIKEISFLLGYIVYLVYGLKDYEKVKECILQEEKLIENNYQKPLANYYREILENIKQDIILNNE